MEFAWNDSKAVINRKKHRIALKKRKQFLRIAHH